MAKALDVAYVEILPDTRRMEAVADKLIRNALKGAEKAAQDTSDEIAKDLDRAFKDAARSADSSMRDVRKEIAATEKAAKDTSVKIKVEVDDEPLRTFTRDAAGRLRDERGKFVTEGRSLGASLAEGIGDGFKGALSGVMKGVGPIIAAAVTGPVTSALSSVAAALVPVAGLFAALLPTAMATATVATQTLTLAFHGFDEVLKNLDKPGKFAKALEDLSPTAQKVALTLRDVLVPAFDRVKFAVQETTFADVPAELKRLADTLTGPLKSGLSGVAQEFNFMFHAIADFLKTSDGINLVNSILANTKSILSDITPAVLPVAKAFGDLVSATQPFLKSLSGGLADIIIQFANFISQAAKSGELQKFLQQGLATLGDLGIIARNVGQILGVLFDSSSDKGRTLLTSLAEITGTFAKFLQSAEGSAAVKALLGFLQTSLGSVLDVVKPLLPLAARMLELLGVEFSTALTALANILEPVANTLADALLPIFPEMIKMAKEVSPLIIQLSKTLGQELGEALSELVPVFIDLFMELLPLAVPIIKLLVDALTFMAPAINLTFLPLKLLGQGVVLLIQGIKALIKWLGDIDWSGIGKAIGKFFTDAWKKVTTFFTGVGNFFAELPGKIGDFLASLPGKFVGLLNTMFDNAVKAIGIGIGLVLAFFIETPRLVVEAVASLPEKLGKFWDSLWADVKTKTATGFTLVLDFIKGIPDKVLVAIGTVRAKVGQLFTDSLAFWRGILTSGFDSVVEFIKSIPNRLVALGGFFRYAGERIINGFIDGIKSIGGFIGDVAGSIVRTIVNFLNRVINKLNEGIAEVDEFLPGSLPRIPNIALAKGGLVTGPTNALIGEAGDEFVLPLQGSRAKKAAEALGISGGSGQTVTFENGAIQISFEGVVPTEQQSLRTGEAVARGITQTLARRNVRTQVRMA